MPGKKQKFILFSFLAMFIFLPFAVFAGLVPCATTEHPEPCTLCHLVVGFWGLIDYGFKIFVFVAVAGLVISGIMYIVSAGNEEMMKTAKNFITHILTGFAVILGAWLLIFVVMRYFGVKSDLGIQAEAWNKFKCNTQSGANMSGVSSPDLSQRSSKLNSNTPATPVTPDTSTTPVTPAIGLSPVSLTFPETGADSISSPQIITVTNTGDGNLKIESVQFSGTNSSDFSQTNTCGNELAKNTACTVSITFKPTAIGSRSAAINITSNATESVKTANLSGNGRGKQCELLAGSKNADFVFMLARSKFGVPSDGMKKTDCSNAVDWDGAKQTDLDAFKAMASEMANGLDLVESSNQSHFAVYRMDEIYDGTNDNVLQDIIKKDCQEASNNKLFSYGYIYNSEGLAGGGAKSGKAYAAHSTKKAFYCIKNDPNQDKVFTHEQIGHIFAKLEDEYPLPECIGSNFWYHNVTRNSSCAKWQNIALSPENCFKGCNCKAEENNCFRSTYNSIMRNHWEPGGVLNTVQNYIINACVQNRASNCPPANLRE